MLNDISRQTRLAIFFQMFGPSLMFGTVFAIDEGVDALVISLFGFGLLVTLGWAVGFTAWSRRADRRLWHAVAAASEEIVRGTVDAVPAVGRVVRRRVARRFPAYLAGTPEPVPGPGMILVVTALVDDGARRVAALAPAGIGLMSRKATVAVLLHPVEREAAVLDPGVTPGQLAAIGTDPRWGTARLPTDRQVVGGYSTLVAVALLGVGAGLALDWLVVALVR